MLVYTEQLPDLILEYVRSGEHHSTLLGRTISTEIRTGSDEQRVRDWVGSLVRLVENSVAYDKLSNSDPSFLDDLSDKP